MTDIPVYLSHVSTPNQIVCAILLSSRAISSTSGNRHSHFASPRKASGRGGRGVENNCVVIHEQKSAGKGTFFHTSSWSAQTVFRVAIIMLFWKKG